MKQVVMTELPNQSTPGGTQVGHPPALRPRKATMSFGCAAPAQFHLSWLTTCNCSILLRAELKTGNRKLRTFPAVSSLWRRTESACVGPEPLDWIRKMIKYASPSCQILTS